MVHLMDRLLKKENLDLKLTPYSVLATGVDNGFVEFVPSMALASVSTLIPHPWTPLLPSFLLPDFCWRSDWNFVSGP